VRFTFALCTIEVFFFFFGSSYFCPPTRHFLLSRFRLVALRHASPPTTTEKELLQKKNNFFKLFLLPGATFVVLICSALDQRSPQHKTQPTKMGGAMTKKAKDQVPSFCLASSI
jgi:hypothetical protein